MPRCLSSRSTRDAHRPAYHPYHGLRIQSPGTYISENPDEGASQDTDRMQASKGHSPTGDPDPRRRDRSEHENSGQQSTSIHILNDDALCHVFSYYRLNALDNREPGDTCALRWSVWEGGYWWYQLMKVCRRWRCLILGYALHFGVGLDIKKGMQVADILARTPPLPLGIDYHNYGLITPQEKEDLLLALQHRDRVRAIRLRMQLPNLGTFIVAMDGEFPILECLIIEPPFASTFPTTLILPATFHAPRLRRLKLTNPALPIPALPILPPTPSLTVPTGLVKLSLHWNDSPTHPFPGTLFQQLPSIPHLEMLQISFEASILSNTGLESQWLHVQTMTCITFPNLRCFIFRGNRNYLETFIPWIKTPLLEILHVTFPNEDNFLAPNLLSFLGTIENLQFSNVMLKLFPWFISLQVNHHRGVVDLLLVLLYGDSRPGAFSQKIAAAGKIVNSLKRLLSTVERLNLRCGGFTGLTGVTIEDDSERMEWCLLFRPFGNVKTLFLDDRWTKWMSLFLPLHYGELPIDLLLELKELRYCTHEDIVVDAFTNFTEACRKAGRPVILVRHYPTFDWRLHE